jgi:hypothetical protein
MAQTLIKDKKYMGKYVALRDFGDFSVIGFGDTPQEAYEKALRRGHNDPVIVFIPLKNLVLIY